MKPLNAAQREAFCAQTLRTTGNQFVLQIKKTGPTKKTIDLAVGFFVYSKAWEQQATHQGVSKAQLQPMEAEYALSNPSPSLTQVSYCSHKAATVTSSIPEADRKNLLYAPAFKEFMESAKMLGVQLTYADIVNAE